MSYLSIAESIRQDYEEEINKQAKVIQWYEKENRHNQEIIIKDIKEIERLNSIINEIEKYAGFGEVNWEDKYQDIMLSSKGLLKRIKELKGDSSND